MTNQLTDTQNKICRYWDAYIYEQQEDETEMARFIVNILGDRPLRILEPACGGGKLCEPLARAGHDVTGFDLNESMLRIAYARAAALPSMHVSKADALTSAWGRGFDAVLLASNIMLNLVTDWDYKQAQKQLIQRAHDALRPGGHLLLDFDCPDSLNAYLGDAAEWVCFDGNDDRGTYGRYIVLRGTCDEHTRMVRCGNRYEITPRVGEPFSITCSCAKHFPTLEQVMAWLQRAGFTVESVSGGYHGEPFDSVHRRAVIWARKAAQ